MGLSSGPEVRSAGVISDREGLSLGYSPSAPMESALDRHGDRTPFVSQLRPHEFPPLDLPTVSSKLRSGPFNHVER